MAAVSAAPIVAAIAAIPAAVSSGGSCPTAPFTVTSWGSHVFDFFASACQIFAQELSTLQTISDACWCLFGILIVATA
jgi:hypothetical protein